MDRWAEAHPTLTEPVGWASAHQINHPPIHQTNLPSYAAADQLFAGNSCIRLVVKKAAFFFRLNSLGSASQVWVMPISAL